MAIISEDLGRGIVAELDPATGDVTLLDAERGVTLAPLQVWLLESFFSEHKVVWLEHAATCVVQAMKGE